MEAEWKQFIPDFSYVYNSLFEMSDKQLEGLSNQFLIASLLTLKHFKESDWLENNARKVFGRADNAQENLFRLLAVYFFENIKPDPTKIIKILESVPKNLKVKVMSALDLLIEEGKLEGKLEGKIETAKKMILSAFSTEQISELLELSSDFVSEMQAELRNQKS